MLFGGGVGGELRSEHHNSPSDKARNTASVRVLTASFKKIWGMRRGRGVSGRGPASEAQTPGGKYPLTIATKVCRHRRVQLSSVPA